MKSKLLIIILIGFQSLGYSQYNILIEEKISENIGGFNQTLDINDWLGYSVESIGDIDGDGIGDVAVGVIKDDDGGTDKGAIYILFLNNNGTVKNHSKISENTGGFTGVLDNNDILGSAISYLGDMNNDGFVDLAIGAEYDDDGGVNHGAIYILSIDSTGSVVSQAKISDSQGGFNGLFQVWEVFGSDVTPLGDLNNDGNPDIAVSARRDSDGGLGKGAVWILFLNSNFTVNSFQKISDTQGNFNGGLNIDDYFGGAVANIGDLDGDGVVDIAVGAYKDDDAGSDIGAIYILFLNSNGTVKSHQKITQNQGGFTETFNGSNVFYGISIDNAPDINGDGLSEIIVGAPGFVDQNNAVKGAFFILNLNANGTVNSYEKITEGLQNFTGPLLPNSYFGFSVSYIGGLQQPHGVVIGNPKDNVNGSEKGSAWIVQFGIAAIDVTTSIDNVNVTCQSRDILVDYSIYNNGSATIPANTPFSFYANTTLVSTQFTQNDIPVGGVETGTISLTIPMGIPFNFTLHLMGDDDGTGNGTLSESDESNNSSSQNVELNFVEIQNQPISLIQCDSNGDGQEQFNLSSLNTQINNTGTVSITYHASQTDADAGTAILPTLYTSGTTTIYARVEDINSPTCYNTAPVSLQVDQAPQANTPQDFIYCDDDNDGVGQFILTNLDDEINNDPSVTITYHQTQANADNNVLPLSSPFTNTVNTTQTIFVRVESPGVDCYSTVTATLIVEDSPQPVLAVDLDPLEACDDDNSGNALFDLTQMEPAILANETTPSDFTVTYYQTQNDADNQTNPITVPAAYTSNGLNQTIYVVVEGLNGCLGETSFELIVNPLPTVNPPSALELCDYNNPGDEQEAFNLNDATLEITGGDNSIDVTYYETQADADAGSNPLSSPYTNTVNNQTIYIRSVDQDTGCSVTQGYTLTLVVNPLPSPQVPVDPLLVCDADNDGFAEFDLDAQIPIITNGEVNVVITYHITQANADAGSNPIDTTQPYGIVSGNGVQTLYVRATNSLTGCYVVEVLELEVVSTPEIGTLEDLFVCDDATADGFAIFDLTVNTTNVIGNQNPADVTVTYYETQADAAAGTNAIAVPSMYTNNMNPQRIFVRIENNATGCIDTFDTANDNSFWIEVEENPDVMDPTNLQLCDDDYATNPVPQNIFNLTVKEGEISGQNFPPSSYEFTYYANNADYQAGTAIGDPTAYENQSNPQTIIVEVVDTTTEGMCASTVNLTIEVLPLPSPSEDDQDVLRLEECDDDNDGIAATGFDLTQSGDQISAGENVVLTYYTTENAAEDGDTTAPEYIADPTDYTNDPSLNITNADGLSVQVIYVRIDSNVNGNFCFVVVSFEIDVVPAPVLNDIEPFGYILCEDGNTGTATIFLEDIAENVYDATLDFDGDPNTAADTSVLIPLLDQTENEDLDINNYTISYHFTEVGAETDTAEVPNGYQASSGESFFIRIEYKDTGCYNTDAIGEVVITVEERPSIDDVDILEQLCSDEQGGDSVTIDLTQYNGQINPGTPANTQVVYYATMDDYMSGNSIDPSQLNAYTTIENPQTIIAEVIDTVTLCESELFATIEIEIGESPIIDISSYDGTVLCEDLDPNTPVVGGDYNSVTIETGLSTTQYDFEWTQDGSTLMETGPSLTVSEPGTYEVTVTDPLTGCASTSSATFASGNPPEFTVESTTLGFNGEHALLISNVTGAGDYEFSVDNGPWIALGADGTLTLDGLSGGVHEVRGRDRNGCGITLNEVFFIDYPKFFTPNQDGYNDTWNIQGISNQLDAKIYIFDRYGKLLKQLSPSSEGWDGTFNGNLMPSNDYWFRVEYTDIDGTRKEFKANFTLKR
jgi:gliding motility-associated-like protein